jgi:hypothetical protein
MGTLLGPSLVYYHMKFQKGTITVPFQLPTCMLLPHRLGTLHADSPMFVLWYASFLCASRRASSIEGWPSFLVSLVESCELVSTPFPVSHTTTSLCKILSREHASMLADLPCYGTQSLETFSWKLYALFQSDFIILYMILVRIIVCFGFSNLPFNV